MLQSTGSQRVRHDLVTEQQQWWCPMVPEAVFIFSFFFFLFLRQDNLNGLIIKFPYHFFYQFKYTAEII